MEADPIVIVSAARTPMGGLLGTLATVPAAILGAAAIKAAIERAGISPDVITENIMGCVLPAGQGQAPARQAAVHADIPYHCGSTTINKMCGSGMKAIMFAHDLLVARPDEVMVAGGFENMSRAPYLLEKARGGYRIGHGELLDHMFFDGLEDAYNKGTLMGAFAEVTAKKYQFTREQQDEFAIASLQRAKAAIDNGHFKEEIVPITITNKKGNVTIIDDEQPHAAKIEKIPALRPAFSKDGTVTAANASSISDGGAAVVMMRLSQAKQRGLTPLAKITAHATHSHEPEWFTTAPVGAIQKVLEKTQWNINDVDLFEINEAFAVVTMAAMHDLKIPHEKVNIHGGACALGHPIGASGARIVVTLLHALKQQKKTKGVAALCIGGGEATALALELLA